MYINTGGDKVEKNSNQTWISWVSDETYTGTTMGTQIYHYEYGTTPSGGTDINTSMSQITWDPDVVHSQTVDSLFVIYYSIEYQSPDADGFPGNGTSSASEYRIGFQRFSATDPPVSGFNNNLIQFNSTTDILYVKNPNIDANINGDIVMVWEEQSEYESNNHVYARYFNSGFTANYLDLDPTAVTIESNEYDFFYNPDVVVFGDQYASGSSTVLITFMGRKAGSNEIDLLLYEATINDISTGATPSSGQYSVIYANMNNSASASKLTAHPLYDHFHRPRIAAHPSEEEQCILWGIVVPEIEPAYLGSFIHTFCQSNTGTCSITQETQTNSLSPALSDALNFEPAISVNTDGYDVVWNYDPQSYINAGFWTGNTPLNPVVTSAFSGVHNTIIRVRTDVDGTPTQSDYSLVPISPLDDEGTCAPSVAYDEMQLFGLTTYSPDDYSVLFGFERTTGGSRWTYNKLSEYTNDYLKKGEADFLTLDEETPFVIDRDIQGSWRISVSSNFREVHVFDVNGKMVWQNTIDMTHETDAIELKIPEMAAGIYVFELLGDQSATRFKLPFSH